MKDFDLNIELHKQIFRVTGKYVLYAEDTADVYVLSICLQLSVGVFSQDLFSMFTTFGLLQEVEAACAARLDTFAKGSHHDHWS